jgi:hypothetical protein
MKKKPKKVKVKKEKKQVVEIHIYIHQPPYDQFTPSPNHPTVSPSTTGIQPWNPPYQVNC